MPQANYKTGNFVTCIGSALLVVLAAPPFNLWPLAFLSLIPIYLLIRNASPLVATFWSWLTGFLILLGGTFWWVDLLGRFADLSLPSSLGITFLFCAYQAIPYAIWGGVCSLLHRRYRVSWIVSGPLVIALSEMIVPFFFKMYLGITLWRVWPLTQVAEIGGPTAITALLALINIVIAEALLSAKEHRMPAIVTKAGMAAILAVLLLGWGRASYIDSVRNGAPSLKVGILQPNFGIVSVEERKHKGEKYIKKLRDATQDLAKEDVDLIVWPETAWPFLFDRQMTREYPPGHPWEMRPGVKGRLLFGTLSHTFGGVDVYNSAVLVSGTGQITGRYDKVERVPFSEYIPFAKRFPEWAKDIREQTTMWPDIVKGSGPEVLVDGDLRVAPLICSEDTDMRYVHEVARKKPNLLVTIASDAWFGESGGAEQHLALATFRAVETRRDLVRATNTGVSAIITASGKVQFEGPLFNVTDGLAQKPTLLTGQVALMEKPGFGPYLIPFFPLACLLGLAAAIMRNMKQQPSSDN